MAKSLQRGDNLNTKFLSQSADCHFGHKNIKIFYVVANICQVS